MTRAPIGLIALLALGCVPQDANITGNWFVWLAANSSPTVDEGGIENLGTTATRFDCMSDRGWDVELGRFDASYIGPVNEEEYKSSRFVGGKCPRAYDEESELYDGDYAPYCDPDSEDEEVLALIEKRAAQCETISDLEFHTFLQDDGVYALAGELSPWRTEAVINGEGHLQLTVHHWLGDGQDMRFTFAIDPDFAPVACESECTEEDEEGNCLSYEAVVNYVDGADWTEKWSEDEPGYVIYYLNAGSYQTNPSDSDDTWYFTSSWNSGYGMAKFAAEEFNSHPNDYENVNTGTLFNAISNREAPYSDSSQEEYGESIAWLEEKADLWAAELYDTAGARADGRPAFTHKIEDNLWRPMDEQTTGIDGWMELGSSWVRLSRGSEVVEGGTVMGDFQILYDGKESGSSFLVTGSFAIDDLREDPWVYPILEEEKREAYETPFCGGAEIPGQEAEEEEEEESEDTE